jgi:hypothetical protein
MTMFDEASFKAGEWIQVVGNHPVSGHVGFIAEFDFWNSRYKVYFTKNPAGKRSGGRMWVDEDRLMSIHDKRHEDDLHELIDFALDDNDKDYFIELSSQLL